MRFQFEMRETQRTQHRRNNYPVVLMTEMGVYSVDHNNHEARFGSETDIVVMYIIRIILMYHILPCFISVAAAEK